MPALATHPVSFSFQESHDIRIQLIGGEPWFCLKDVCDVLTIANSRRVASEVLDQDGVRKAYITDSLVRDQEAAFVNEPNLYRVIFRSNKPEAKQFQDWVFNEVLPAIRKTGRYEKQPPAEPLSNKDMNNLKRLVWMMTGRMRFDGAWNSAVWYSLRSATGRPSPQPFSVEDLPVLGEECRRILKITSAVHTAVYDFEKDVIRKVIRKRGEIEPLLNDMRLKLLELQEQESRGLLMLNRFDENGIQGLVNRQ